LAVSYKFGPGTNPTCATFTFLYNYCSVTKLG
jgi:hypothetical protein